MSNEVFIDIKSRKTEDDLSKSYHDFNCPTLEITFGDELGGLLWRQAEREESFPNVNTPDAVRMAPLDSSAIPEVAALREARKNDREIRSNIPKLIRILSKQKDRRDKLEKEFAQQIKNSEIKNFTY